MGVARVRAGAREGAKRQVFRRTHHAACSLSSRRRFRPISSSTRRRVWPLSAKQGPFRCSARPTPRCGSVHLVSGGGLSGQKAAAGRWGYASHAVRAAGGRLTSGRCHGCGARVCAAADNEYVARARGQARVAAWMSIVQGRARGWQRLCCRRGGLQGRQLTAQLRLACSSCAGAAVPRRGACLGS